MDVKWIIDTLVIALPLLYGATVGAYGRAFFTSRPAARKLGRGLLAGTAATHLLYLTIRTIQFDHPPITSVFEIMTMLAFCIAIAYMYIELRTRTDTTGFFILSLALLFQTVSSLFIKDLLSIPQYLHSLVLGFHVAAALLGYTAISLSATYGFLYLMLYHEIKSSRLGIVYTRLPDLETLETMSHRAEVFGFAMLGAAILIGLFWLPRVFDSFSYWDPKLVGSVLIWLMYAAGLAAKRKLGWQGRKTMIVSLVAFGFVFLSMTIINLYLTGFHSFH